MASLFTVDHVTQTFKLPGGGAYVALRDIFLTIAEGEFISLVGHSGCGKSTLLNLLAGLTSATQGGILMNGREVTDPGPDRMVVFQNYSLLPWLTVRENIALGVDNVIASKDRRERDSIIEHHIQLVGLKAAADKYPREISGGMKQRVAIARALALRPKLLLLDEPFGALDALTRGNLQEQLMQICQEAKVTSLMVTHDVDEALLLSDRVVLMTNGPEAHIDQIIEVPLPRPRTQLNVVEHPRYYALRAEIVGFLSEQRRARQTRLKPADPIASNGLEKVNLELGFIPLTDCLPLVVAQEMGFFARHGLSQVRLRRESNWKTLETHVRQNVLDGALMVAGMPIAMTLGFNDQEPLPMVSALTLSCNGNAITLHRRFHEAGVTTLAEFKDWIDAHPNTKPVLAMVHPASMHNLILRAWLASAGIHPERDVELLVIPPPQMVAALKAGTIDGYCVGEPWNSRAVLEGLGTVIATDVELWNGHCEKVLGVREAWAAAYPRTHQALVQALLEACRYCDDPAHRDELAELLSQSQYVGTDVATIRPGLIDAYDRGTGAPTVMPSFNRFFGPEVNEPNPADAVWILSQLGRWGLTSFPSNWQEVADRVQDRALFRSAAAALGLPTTAQPPSPVAAFNGDRLDPVDPLGYLDLLAVKGQVTVAPAPLSAPASR
ncbi:nitrate ABC transporter ATP-binding protein [Synechococcus sp. CCY 0621]|uniref:ABC transporter ATP-binding/substrate-binding protein n=1 Tax=Synechococcus sp. CCY 0621 TaxID=2815603 RepID=UPI001C233A1A|nr:nitrate ABC transporter ATP-binding protein [Synechococcus sp. CCY 0621]